MVIIQRTLKDRIQRLININRLNLGLFLSILFQLLIVTAWYHFELFDLLYESGPYAQDVRCEDLGYYFTVIDGDGEIEIVDKLPVILDAPDLNYINASAPLDLNPRKLTLTPSAKEAGVSGTLTLELIIDEKGNVLQVRSIGRELGYGLEEKAIKIYKAKKFYPSYLNNKPIQVKIFIPVRFKLDDSI